MKLSHIKIQQSIITIHSKKSKQDIQSELLSRNTVNTNQVSIFNSTFDISQTFSLEANIEIFSIRKSTILRPFQGSIVASNLKALQLSLCNIVQVPRIQSSQLLKLNLSHNQIEEMLDIPCKKTLKWLDLRDNRLLRITTQILLLPQLKLEHQFLNYNFLNSSNLLNQLLSKTIISLEEFLAISIYGWDDQSVLCTCEQIITNNNDHLFNQIIEYLNDDLLQKIYEIAKVKKKHKILQLLIREGKRPEITPEDRATLLLPQLLPLQILRSLRLQNIVKSISESNSQKNKVLNFLSYIESIHESFMYIQSEKDLIAFMSYSSKYPHSYEHQFLISHKSFFSNYQFENRSIITYLLQFDSIALIKMLLESQRFKDKVLSQLNFKRMLKPNSKFYKIMYIAMKEHQKQRKSVCNNWYYPQYRQRKSFCIKNDLYDYQILGEYEQMQCSYLKKDFRYTIKIFNKQNQISVAKKVQNQLKKSKIKSINKNIQPSMISIAK